eukprot:4610801-Heterocapsa_arctica.AAC.1
MVGLSSKEFLNVEIKESRAMVVHHSRAPEDGDNHSIMDLFEAEDEAKNYDGQTLKLLYYAGPSAAVLTVEPLPWSKD